MASLPVPFRRRQSKPVEAVDTIARKPAALLALVPLAIAGGALVFRKLRRTSPSDGASVGPVAHASSVSPPINGVATQPVGPRAAT